jgi:hypothetical protein
VARQLLKAWVFTVCVAPFFTGCYDAGIVQPVSSVSAVSLCTPVPSGIVAWWQGENNANDSQSSFNGTIFGGVTFAAGEVGNAFVFNGTTGFVNAGDVQATNLDFTTADFTVTFWINTTQSVSPGGIGAFVLGNGVNLGQGPGFRAVLQAGGDEGVRFRVASGTQATIVDTIAVADGNWHFIALTRQGVTLSTFVDGVAGATATCPIATCPGGAPINVTTNGSFQMGARGTNGDSFFNGSVDEIAIFNRVLTPTEIQGIFSTGTNGMCR